MEHITKTIQTKAKRELLGRELKCRFCNYEEAKIILEDFRYMVRCARCQQEYLLKEQHNT